VSGVLAYDPQRLATLASSAQTAADELAAVTGEEAYSVDAIAVAHGIAASLDETLLTALRAVLTSAAMTEWNGAAFLLTVDQLIDALTEQATNPSARFVLDDGEFSIAASITAAEQAQWFHDVNPGCVTYAGGSYIGGGYVADHRGNRYPIVVARVETEDGDVFTADRHPVAAGEPSVATLGGSDPGWEVVGCATGIERFQAEPSFGEELLAAFGGTTGRVRPLPPNSGLAYIAVPASGGPPHLVDEPPTPRPLVAPPAVGVPDPANSSPGAIVEGAAALAVTTAQGGVMAGALDNQTQRAYQVIFEENGDGRRRARIQTYTLAHDGEGGVVIIPEHVYVDGNGELTSQTISYGSPYDADGVSLSASTEDVAPLAFSGNEPITYPVPDAVFP
jgi:hypothetical protein